MFKNLFAAPARLLVPALSLLSLAAATLSPLAPAHAQSPVAPPKPIKAAWVYVSPLAPTGWVRQHDQGRLAVQAALGAAVKTSYVENVAEGADAERVIRDLAAQGNDIIFTPSFGYMEATMKVAKEYPNVKFESITGYKRADNVATANARYFEGRYLAGWAAGRMATQLGYIAAFPIPEVVQGINAFTRGARAVNPDATVKVIWLGEWFNPAKEREAATTLFNQGIELLAFHTASDTAMAVAQERGKLAIGYHSDMSAAGPTAQLLSVVHQWGDYYTERVRAVQNGTWKSTNTWGGMGQGMVKIDHFGPKLPSLVVKELLGLQKELADGRRRVFAGAIMDNTKVWRFTPEEAMTDAQIQSMDWFIWGVNGSVK